MKKIRIAYLTKNLRINGISTVIMNYCEYLNKDIFDVTIFAGNPIEESLKKRCEEIGVHLVETPQKRGRNPLKYYLFILRNLSNKKYDIVHIHGNSATITVELLIAKIKRIKLCITHSHSTTCDHLHFHRMLKPVLNRLSDLRFACGKNAGEWMYGENAFEVLANGFNTDKFKFDMQKRKNMRKKLNIEDKIVLGHVGIFTYEKNHEFIIDIFEKIAKQDSRYVLLLVGAGPKFKTIKEKVERSEFKDRIIMYGETNDVKEMYDAMDIFILPSRAEGLGIVLIEAQLNGLNCIVSEAIPEDAIICDSVKKVSIETPKLWIEEILKYKFDIRNKNNMQTKKVKDFNIEESIKILESYYVSVRA